MGTAGSRPANGQPWYNKNYEHGLEHGRQQGWYLDGQPSYDYNYEHGKQHGSVRGWGEYGNLTRDAWYEHDVWWDRIAAQRLVGGQTDITAMASLVLVSAYL